MNRREFLALPAALPASAQGGVLEIATEAVDDKIRGGLLGEILGDLNGLVHEMKYIAEPGNVGQYTPALPDGAWTDDDTDIEWPYLIEIQRGGNLLLAPRDIAALWKRHINRRIWCSHLYLRQLLDIGIEPPLTGSTALNPWAEFNLSGQFVAETWGLISPGMPRTAARTAAHYVHVSVEGEPVQSAQMIASMIAAAFFTSDTGAILDAGAAALDPKSTMRRIVADVRQWHAASPRDWRAVRVSVKEKYCLHGGQDMRDRNGVWLNGASVIAALLFGAGDFAETARAAFNFGWDADNNAAAACAVVGVTKGARWLLSRGWNIQDRYRNTSRDELPGNETITSYGDRVIAVARINIEKHGGRVTDSLYRIAREKPANMEPLPDLAAEPKRLKKQLLSGILEGLRPGAATQLQARAAYLAICLDLARDLAAKYRKEWPQAVAALNGYPRLLQTIFYQSDIPAGDRIRVRALAAGVVKPAAKIAM
jgi:hypothetical protein